MNSIALEAFKYHPTIGLKFIASYLSTSITYSIFEEPVINQDELNNIDELFTIGNKYTSILGGRFIL